MYNAYVRRGNIVQLGNDITCDGFPENPHGIRIQTHAHTDHTREWEKSMRRTIIMTPQTKELILAERNSSSERVRSNLITHPADGTELREGNSRIRFYNSGHMLGTCMVAVFHSGTNYLYTSDFSWPLEPHVSKALKKLYTDVLVLDASYGHPENSVRNYNQSQVHETLVAQVKSLLDGNKPIKIIAHRGRLQHAYQLLADEFENADVLFKGSEKVEQTIDIYNRAFCFDGNQFVKQDQMSSLPYKQRFIELVDARDSYITATSTSTDETIIRLKETRSRDNFSTETRAGWQISMTDHADFKGTIALAHHVNPRGGILTVGEYAKELAQHLADNEGFEACCAIMPPPA